MYYYTVQDYANNHDSIYNQNILEGDPFQLLKPVSFWLEPYHTMIIVGYDSNNHDFIYAGHTNDTNDSHILSNIVGNSAYQSHTLQFFSMS